MTFNTAGDNQIGYYQKFVPDAHGPCPTCGKCRCCSGGWFQQSLKPYIVQNDGTVR